MSRTGKLSLALAVLLTMTMSMGLATSAEAGKRARRKPLTLTVLSRDVIASSLQWLRVSATVITAADVTFEIVPASGDPTPVFSIVEPVATSYTFEWRGRTADGTRVPNGDYVLTATRAGYSAPDATVHFTVDNTPPPDDFDPPAIPDGLAVLPGLNNLLTWEPASAMDLAYYRVYSSTDKETWKHEGRTVFGRFTDASVREGIIWYRVSAVDVAENESAMSRPVSNGWEPPPPPPPPPIDSEATIGPEGGSIVAGTVSLAVPPGALAEPTAIRVRQWDTPPVAPGEALAFMGPGFEITPTGLQFAVPAQLTIQMRAREDIPMASGFPVEESFMGVFDPSTQTYVKVAGYSVDETTRTVTAPLAHLSDYVPVGITDAHGVYTETTNLCGICHTSHAAPGPNLSPKPTQLETCVQCHGGTPTDGRPASEGVGAFNNVQNDFGLTKVSDFSWTSTKTSYHPLAYTPAAAGSPLAMVCGDCHTAHKKRADYTELLRVWAYGSTTSTKIYAYSLTAGPAIGNAMCYNCHGTTNPRLATGNPAQGPLPAPYGNHTMTGKAHDAIVPGGVTEVQSITLSLSAGTPAVDEVQSVNISTLTAGTAGVDEVQRYSVGRVQGGNGGDTYTLTYSGCTTGVIRRDATAAQIQAALDGCAALNGNVSVSTAGTNPIVVTITFINGLAATNVAQITHTNVSGAPVTVAPSTVTQGAPAVPGEGFTLTFNGQTTATMYKTAVTAAEMQTKLEALNNIGAGDVSVSGTTGTGPFTVTFQGALGGTNVSQMTGTGLGGHNPVITTTTQGVPGVPAETFTLTFNGQTTSSLARLATAAQVDAALEALSTIGAGNVVVTGADGGPYTVTFAGSLANNSLPQITGTPVAPKVVTSTITDGVTATAPTGYVYCDNCHKPHASNNVHLTTASQETLCFNCHTAATPNASGGTNPPWTMGPVPASNPYNEFNAKANDYSATDGDPIQIYHHPIATGEQAGGTRQVECASCHNVHIADKVDSAGGASRAADPANIAAANSAWNFGWDFASGYMSRGTNVQQFCYKCHGATPAVTAPLNAGGNVPYNVRLVDDSAAVNTGGDLNNHDMFTQADWTANSRHQDTVSTTYKAGTPAGSVCQTSTGTTSDKCKVTCTNCHDVHGSTNAWMLREDVVSPDRYQNYTITGATWVSGTITLTTSVAPSLQTSYQVVVSGVASGGPGDYNGIFDVNSVSGTTVTLQCAGLNPAPPLSFCDLTTNPGTYTPGQTGGRLVVGRLTLTDMNGTTTGNDPYELQSFCRTCHVERGTHNGPNPDRMCTDCHYHTAGTKSF